MYRKRMTKSECRHIKMNAHSIKSDEQLLKRINRLVSLLLVYGQCKIPLCYIIVLNCLFLIIIDD